MLDLVHPVPFMLLWLDTVELRRRQRLALLAQEARMRTILKLTRGARGTNPSTLEGKGAPIKRTWFSQPPIFLLCSSGLMLSSFGGGRGLQFWPRRPECGLL